MSAVVSPPVAAGDSSQDGVVDPSVVTLPEGHRTYWLLGEPSNPDFKLSDSYKIIRKLGHGNFSEVYEVESKETGKAYAAKVIRKSRLTSPKHLSSLQAEIAILKDCKHANIVCMEEVLENRGVLVILLELARGGELFEEIVDHGAYSERDASNIVRQIVRALCYLHERSVAHRDLKPENILLAEKGSIDKVKLADFGLAKIISNFSTSTPCGTPGYVAPEVLLMLGYGIEVDMWSTGVIAYILLCGYPPFHHKQPALLYDKIKRADYKFHDRHWSDISDLAKDFIRRLLVVDPKQRLTAAQALAHPWLHGLGTPAQPLPALFAQLRRFQAQRKGSDDSGADTPADPSTPPPAAPAEAAQPQPQPEAPQAAPAPARGLDA